MGCATPINVVVLPPSIGAAVPFFRGLVQPAERIREGMQRGGERIRDGIASSREGKFLLSLVSEVAWDSDCNCSPHEVVVIVDVRKERSSANKAAFAGLVKRKGSWSSKEASFTAVCARVRKGPSSKASSSSNESSRNDASIFFESYVRPSVFVSSRPTVGNGFLYNARTKL